MLAQQEEDRLGELYLAYRSCMQAAESAGQPCLAGKLLLLGEPLRAFAGRLAGGAALLAMPDAGGARSALRAGWCDFLVTDLDEAVRILKNEIRRGAPVSVCLPVPLHALEEKCELRGLQPDFIEGEAPVLEGRGARLLAWETRLRDGEEVVRWRATSQGPRELAICDRFLAELLPERDEERRRWLRQAPFLPGRHLHRTRLLPMTANEIARCRNRVRETPEAQGCTILAGREQLWPAL